jgi:peptidoglycan-associated lipoprotein
MKNKVFLTFFGVLGIAGLLLAGCGGSSTVAGPQATSTNISEAQLGQEPSIRADADGEYIKTIHFAFDKSDISTADAEILKSNVEFLNQNPNTTIVVEGHCDSRGTIAYNLALGQRRAVKVKEFYVSLGIAPDRVGTISYGEEKPVDATENDSAYSKNRRAETKVITQ